MTRAAWAALALLAAGWAATLWLPPWSDERVNDLYVYRSFATPVLDGALPYRDAFFEYPPLAAPAIALPGLVGTGEEAFRWAFAGWTLALAAATVLLCGALAARTGGDRTRALMAAALTPLLCGAMVRTHFDLAPVAIALTALLLLSTNRPRTGMAVLGLGGMTKAFPLAAAPIALAWLIARGNRRAAAHGTIALIAAAATIALAAIAASPTGAANALTYHLDRPVQIESTPATILLALDAIGAGKAQPVSSHRSDGLTHPADEAITAALAMLLAATIAALAYLAVRATASTSSAPRAGGGEHTCAPERSEGDARKSPTGPARHGSSAQAERLVLASLAAMTALAALGKVLSPQFVLWTIPLGALAFAWRMHALAATVALAAILTQVEFPAHYLDVVAREPPATALVALRNAVLVTAVALAARELLRAPHRPRRAATRAAAISRREGAAA